MGGIFSFLKRAVSHKTGRFALSFMAASLIGDKVPVIGELVATLLNPQITIPVGTAAITLRDKEAKKEQGK